MKKVFCYIVIFIMIGILCFYGIRYFKNKNEKNKEIDLTGGIGAPLTEKTKEMLLEEELASDFNSVYSDYSIFKNEDNLFKSSLFDLNENFNFDIKKYIGCNLEKSYVLIDFNMAPEGILGTYVVCE